MLVEKPVAETHSLSTAVSLKASSLVLSLVWCRKYGDKQHLMNKTTVELSAQLASCPVSVTLF